MPRLHAGVEPEVIDEGAAQDPNPGSRRERWRRQLDQAADLAATALGNDVVGDARRLYAGHDQFGHVRSPPRGPPAATVADPREQVGRKQTRPSLNPPPMTAVHDAQARQIGLA